MFAALIGSWGDPRRPADAPHEMLAQAVEFLDSNAGEPVIGLGQLMMSTSTWDTTSRISWMNLDC